MPRFGAELRKRLNGGTATAPGIWDGMSALLAREAGFEVGYASGAAMSAAAGLPDIGLLTMTEILDRVRLLVRAFEGPVVVDGDTGFGGPGNLARLVAELEEAGAAALHVEDQVFPKRCGHLDGKQVVNAEEMVQKIRMAVAARKSPDFLIIARTDARSVNGFEDAVERGRAFLDAGADMVFPEALQSAEEFRDYARLVPGLLMANMTEFGKTPYLRTEQFAAWGYRLVIFPVTGLRVAMKAIAEAFAEVKTHGTQVDLLPRMLTREELYRLLRYAEVAAAEAAAFGEAESVLQRRRASPGN